MTDQTNTPENLDDLEITPEVLLVQLKTKADTLGIRYHPSISYDKLLEKVRAAQTDDASAAEAPKEDIATKRAALRAEAMKLVRVNITNMNPFKRDIESEIVSAGNAYVGTVKRCIPFNTSEGWHVEQILLNTLRERKCQVFRTIKGTNGQPDRRESQLINEFAIEVLPPLTEKELTELARRQAIAKAVD